jgi:acyl transferase domain-containing protein
VLGELGAVAAGLEHRVPQVTWAGALAGELIDSPEPGYWAKAARRPVRFADALAALAARDVSVFIEVGPDGTLSALGPAVLHRTSQADGSQELEEPDEEAAFVPLLRPGQPAPDAVLAALARVYSCGVSVDWGAVLGGGTRVELPTYPFQHQRYWPRRERERRDRPAAENWRYRISWAPVPEPEPARLSGTWLLAVPAEGNAAAEWVPALESRGAQVVLFETGPDETDRSALARALAQALERAGAVAGVISLLAMREAPAAAVAATLTLIQALGDARVAAPLWVVTRGAVATGTDDPVRSPAQTMVWGLGQTAGLEHPDRWGGLIDIPAAWDDQVAGRVCAVLAGCGEDQVAVRAGGIKARRLVRADPPAAGGSRWSPKGTVLVTGGTGAIGGHVARLAAGRGGSRVALASRSGPTASGVAGLAAALAAAGAGAEVVACDSADRAQLSGLLTRIAASGPPLTAVMHAAGAGQGSSSMADMAPAELAEMVAAKASGAAHLDELTAPLGLEQFVLFSSAAATWGSGGQAGYAAANAFLDGLAAHRRSRGLAGTSVAWGLWDGGGMGDGDGGTTMQRRGLQAMAPDLAVRALAQVLDDGDCVMTVADVDWARFAPAFTIRRPSPLIGDLAEVRQAQTLEYGTREDGALDAASGTAPAQAGLRQRLSGLPAAERSRVILELVRAEAAAALGLPTAETVKARLPFRELGFDSLSAVELRNRLTAATGLRLPPTVVFDYPTPAVLAGYLRAEIGQDAIATGDPVLAGLEQLEAALSVVPGDGDTRASVTSRLQTLLARLTGTQDPPKPDSVATRLQSATADEVLSFIDSELSQ